MQVRSVERISKCFDSKACRFCKDYEESGISKSSKILLDQLSDYGFEGKNLLDLGCGIGSFSVRALQRVVVSSVGFDLSTEMISMACRLSDKSGLNDRVSFNRGDASKVNLPPSEIVVLDKVMCCYPDIKELLCNSSGAAIEYYAFIIPRSDNLGSRILATTIITIGNLISRILSLIHIWTLPTTPYV